MSRGVKASKQDKNNNSPKINSNNNNNHNNKSVNIDNIDKKIIELLIANHDNSYIAQKLAIPLSTIQYYSPKN
jgi:hypothetical protein